MTTARETLTLITAVPETARATKGTLLAGERGIPCAFGRGGVTRDKQEGDGCTPLGDWPLRKLYYRADRLSTPDTALEKTPISGDDGWCDDPGSSFYNQPVSLPFTASHEQLFRTDHLYDLMIPMGYNDKDVTPGAGSAIFFHLARENYQPTEGCVAVSLEDMLSLLPRLSSETILRVAPQPEG